jgi:flagellar FliL protein
MAKDDELELDTAKPGSGKGKLIVIIVAVMLLTSGIVIGVLYFTGGLGGTKSKTESKETHEEVKELEVKPAFYLDLQPPFVVNFEDQTHAAYLQIEMQVMARDKEVLDVLTKHMPVVRNNILLILSAQKFEVVKTRQGKESLQKIILESLQQTVLEATQGHAGEDKKSDKKDSEKEHAKEKPLNIEQVYFTSFIMQ